MASAGPDGSVWEVRSQLTGMGEAVTKQFLKVRGGLCSFRTVCALRGDVYLLILVLSSVFRGDGGGF